MTFYKSISQLPDFEDYNMTGRTYRYMNDTPLFPFGYGLSYTTFKYDTISLDKTQVKSGKTLKLSVPIVKTGDRDGDEVVQVYLRKIGDKEGPIKTLRAFKRIHLQAGKAMTVIFNLGNKELEWWDESTNTMRVYPGEYEILVGGSSDDKVLQSTILNIIP